MLGSLLFHPRHKQNNPTYSKVKTAHTLVLPHNGELCKGHRWQLQAIRKGDDLHSTWTLGGVVLQTLGHFFLLYKQTKNQLPQLCKEINTHRYTKTATTMTKQHFTIPYTQII